MKVLLTALSAKHIHKALAPWCLKAYCDNILSDVKVVVQEHTINDHINEIAQAIYTENPDVVGFSCYIWNIEQVEKLAALVKIYLPKCTIVCGGPEVSFASNTLEYPWADYIIEGAGEVSFAQLILKLKQGNMPKGKILPQLCSMSFDKFPSPFTREYFESFAEGKMGSIENQLVYYESSRGCPFSCGYCLSSVTDGVQYLPLERVKQELRLLVEKGAACIKFVDRTFNAKKQRAKEILLFISALNTSCTFHFEVAADLFDDEMLSIIEKMPTERTQFEIGIQSTNLKTLEQVQRKTNLEKVFNNIKALTGMGNCHVHIDLIAGLPFDTINTFAKAIDACYGLNAHMLQLGFLKLLKGSALREQAQRWAFVYDPFPPYEIIKNHVLSVEEIMHLQQIERVIDKFYNTGMYKHTISFAVGRLFNSPYQFFSELADFCKGRQIKQSLKNSYAFLAEFLLPYGRREEILHYIKLDCLTFDFKTQLPEIIPQKRARQAEAEFKYDNKGKFKKIRAEYFPFDEKTRIFIYDEKHLISKMYPHIIVPNEEAII